MYEPLKLTGRLGHGDGKATGLSMIRELDVNALNFCRFAIASLPDSGTPTTSMRLGKGKEKEGILVVPSLLDSEYVRRLLFDSVIPSVERIYLTDVGGRISPT